MNSRRTVLLYQLFTALSDGATGLALLAAPAFTLAQMQVPAPPEALPYVRYLGAFVLSTGLACAYGAWATQRRRPAELSAVWLLTAITRTLVALCVAAQIASGALDPHWATVAAFDGALALVQFLGLRRRWPANSLHEKGSPAHDGRD